MRTIITMIIGIMLISCSDQFEIEPKNNPEAIFDNLWDTFNTDYAVFEERSVDWDYQYSVFKPSVNPNMPDQDLYLLLTDMLKSLNDGHVYLLAKDFGITTSNEYYNTKKEDELFDLNLIKSTYLKNKFEISGEEGGNLHGWIGELGYVHFKWESDNLEEFGNILNEFDQAKGLIIDLRHNIGGDFTYGISEFGRLTQKNTFVFESKTKNGPSPDDFTDWHKWYLEPSGTYLNKPIAVLTDRYTISAGERIVMMLNALPQVTVVGDTTNGSISTAIGKELVNGWNYSIAIQKVKSHDGMSYEGIGIPPDIYVKNDSLEMLAGVDNTLEEAISLLK